MADTRARAGRRPRVSAERLSGRVIGQVQGVGFRYWAQRHARRLGLTGWVRNARDGRTMETVAEGEPADLAEFETLLRSGPPGALVDRGEFERQAATGEFRDFAITRPPDG